MSANTSSLIVEIENRTRKLPLWKEWIKQNTFNYGDVFRMQDLENYFGVPRESARFRREIMPIQRYLRHKGMVLSEAGQMGESLVIKPVETNTSTGLSMERKGINMIFESLVLLNATPKELLTSEQARELEHAANKVATTAALIVGKNHVKALKI